MPGGQRSVRFGDISCLTSGAAALVLRHTCCGDAYPKQERLI